MAINGVSATRRKADVDKLKELQAKMPNVLKITKITGEPARSINLMINIPTVKNSSYPREKQETTEVQIDFSENYPFPPGPTVNFKTPIWNPNVYKSGKWCFGEWKVTENLELFVIRLMKVIALDPTIINPSSAANGEAAKWFNKNIHSNMFPIVDITSLISQSSKPSIAWRSIK